MATARAEQKRIAKAVALADEVPELVSELVRRLRRQLSGSGIEIESMSALGYRLHVAGSISSRNRHKRISLNDSEHRRL